MNDHQILSGHALLGEDLLLRPVDIVIEKGHISAVEENPRAPSFWICPAFSTPTRILLTRLPRIAAAPGIW